MSASAAAASTAASAHPTIYHEDYPTTWRFLLVVVFPLAPIFWRYRVDVSKTTLTVGYSYAYSQIDRNHIVCATPIEYVNGLTQWGGWGIRYNLRGEMGYIVKNGPAVRIEVQRNKEKEAKGDDNYTKVYVFNCQEAERVCQILNGGDEWREQ